MVNLTCLQIHNHVCDNFVELKAPETETVPQIPSVLHAFMPQLTIEKNGLVIGGNTNTPKELLALVLEVVSYV